jgi:hypothetical protein
VWNFSADHFGSLHTASPAIVAIVASPTNFGYWLFGADGKTHALGDAQSFGDAPAHLHAPIVGAVAT